MSWCLSIGVDLLKYPTIRCALTMPYTRLDDGIDFYTNLNLQSLFMHSPLGLVIDYREQRAKTWEFPSR